MYAYAQSTACLNFYFMADRIFLYYNSANEIEMTGSDSRKKFFISSSYSGIYYLFFIYFPVVSRNNSWGERTFYPFLWLIDWRRPQISGPTVSSLLFSIHMSVLGQEIRGVFASLYIKSEKWKLDSLNLWVNGCRLQSLDLFNILWRHPNSEIISLFFFIIIIPAQLKRLSNLGW